MPLKTPWIFALGLLALSATARADQAHDIVLGNGTVGPYTLSWKQVAVGTESVHIDTLLQTQGLDYAFDTNAGTVTFTKPLAAQAAAEIDYQYDPVHAAHTGANLAIPLSLDLARFGHGSLSLDANYKQTGDMTDPNTGSLAVGLGGNWQDAHGQLTTRLLFAPQTQSGGDVSGDAMTRTGLALSTSTQISSATKFSFGFTRIGADLGTIGADNGWQDGVQTLTLGGSFTPSQKAAASVNYTQADPLAAGKAMTSQLAASLTLTPLRALQIQTHWTAATDAGVDTNTADFSLDAKPNAATELTASLSGKDAPGADAQTLSMGAKITPNKALSVQAQVGQSAAGQTGTTQTASLNVAAQTTTTSQVNASFALSNAPGTTADTQAVNVATKVAPTKVISLNASAGQTRLGDAATDSQQLALSLTPRSQVQLHTGVVLSQTDQYQTTAANFGGTLKPVAFLQFSADYTNRIAPVADAALCDSLDTSTAQVALTPMKGLKVTGSYAQNPGDGSNLQHIAQRGVGLETTVGAVSLTGGYDWSHQYDTPDIGTTLNFGLGLRVSSALQITGGYKQALTSVGTTPAGTSLYSFGLTHNLGDRFNLSMTGTMQQQTGVTVAASPDYTASANLGMKF